MVPGLCCWKKSQEYQCPDGHTPDFANVEYGGVLTQVGPDEVGIGSVIVVQPGEKVPIDGVVVDGA